MKTAEKKLLRLYRELSENDASALLSFAEFLSARDVTTSELTRQHPIDIPRPEMETVIAAIKRLSATYPMLDDPKILNETTNLMTQHVMQGREALVVIDELEALFEKYYQHYSNLF